MDGDEQGPSLDAFEPSWLRDGQGIYGAEGEPDFSSNQQWDTNAWSRLNDDQGSADTGNNCTPESDTSKSYVQVKSYVDGKWKCVWTETTTCP